MTQELSSILKKVGLKVTPARKQIFDLFTIDCNPINVEFIFSKLKSKSINQVTIYRTLASFEQVGIIKKVDVHKDSAYYEFATHHHHHIICNDCGKTEGFENCDIAKISKDVLKKSKEFSIVDQHSLELFGLCKDCSNV